MEQNTKTLSTAGSDFTMEDWRRLQETVIEFFSAWLKISGTPLIIHQSNFWPRLRYTRWWNPTEGKTPPTFAPLRVQFVSGSFGAEVCPSAFKQSYKIAVYSCLEPQLEEELDRLCSLITTLTGVACNHY